MGTGIQAQQKQGISTFLSSPKIKENIINVIGEKSMPTFITSIVSAVSTNPALAECTNASIYSAALLGESLKLTPSPQMGQYYLVPYQDRKTGVTSAQFQLGAKGYKQLAIRSGQYRRIVVSSVKEGELKYFNPITEEIEFEPIMDIQTRVNAKVIGYYAMFELMNGFKKEIYWSKEKMQKHAETYSSGYRNDLRKRTAYTFWSKDFDGMAEKTMIRQLISKWGIMSIDMQKAFESDMAVLDTDGSKTYVDNQVDIAEEVQAEISENANTEDFEIVEDVVVDDV